MRPRRGCGSGCATSTRCRAGIRASRDSQIENGEPADKVGCIRNFHLQNGDRSASSCWHSATTSCSAPTRSSKAPWRLQNYVATLRLTPVTDGDRCFIEWSAEFDCDAGMEDELSTGIGGNVFQAGFDALKRHFGGRAGG